MLRPLEVWGGWLYILSGAGGDAVRATRGSVPCWFHLFTAVSGGIVIGLAVLVLAEYQF